MKVVEHTYTDLPESDMHAWGSLLEIHSNSIPSGLKVTKAARSHWRKNKSKAIFGYVDFSGLGKEDILSVLSAAQSGQARVARNRFGDISEFKLYAA